MQIRVLGRSLGFNCLIVNYFDLLSPHNRRVSAKLAESRAYSLHCIVSYCVLSLIKTRHLTRFVFLITGSWWAHLRLRLTRDGGEWRNRELFLGVKPPAPSGEQTSHSQCSSHQISSENNFKELKFTQEAPKIYSLNIHAFIVALGSKKQQLSLEERIQLIFICRCDVIPFDTTGNNNDTAGPIDEKSNQWFGATVSSSGEDGVIVVSDRQGFYPLNNVSSE